MHEEAVISHNQYNRSCFFFGLNETQQIPMPYNYKQFIKKKSFDSIDRISEKSLRSFNGAAPTQPIY